MPRARSGIDGLLSQPSKGPLNEMQAPNAVFEFDLLFLLSNIWRAVRSSVWFVESWPSFLLSVSRVSKWLSREVFLLPSRCAKLPISRTSLLEATLERWHLCASSSEGSCQATDAFDHPHVIGSLCNTAGSHCHYENMLYGQDMLESCSKCHLR